MHVRFVSGAVEVHASRCMKHRFLADVPDDVGRGRQAIVLAFGQVLRDSVLFLSAHILFVARGRFISLTGMDIVQAGREFQFFSDIFRKVSSEVSVRLPG